MAGADEGKGLLLVMIDIDAEHEEEFNRWYEEEHLPERKTCPGFLSARRFVSVDGEPKYLAIYDLESVEVLDTDAYKRIAGPFEDGPDKNSSELPPHRLSRCRPTFFQVRRSQLWRWQRPDRPCRRICRRLRQSRYPP